MGSSRINLARVRWRGAVWIVGAVSLLGVGVAAAQIPASNGTITACYGRSGGSLRVIDADTTTCKNGETQVQWNQSGPAGPQGPAGSQGPAGPQGPAVLAKVYTTSLTALQDLPSTIPTPELLSLTLPAGSYSVAATVNAQSVAVEGYVGCEVAARSSSVVLHKADGFFDVDVLTIIGVVTLPDAGTLTLKCGDTTNQPATATGATLMATPVGEVVVQ